MIHKEEMIVAAGQIAPVWGSRDATTAKICDAIETGANKDADLIGFGEALLPGYPYWLDLTGGARFNDARQKEMHAFYMAQAVDINAGHLKDICTVCEANKIAAYVGVIERATDRGGHSLYCAYVFIDKTGRIASVHRKLMPTYEERLAWSTGDGNGLRVHALDAFMVGGLNCWENWMPLTRAAMYGQGETLRVAGWPGSLHNTEDISRFMAKEGRQYVLSVSSMMHKNDFPEDVPLYDDLMVKAPKTLSNGGSCVAAPDGTWVMEPVVGKEGIFTATIDAAFVRRERQNFDPAGHYSRPDVLSLHVDRDRQSTVTFKD